MFSISTEASRGGSHVSLDIQKLLTIAEAEISAWSYYADMSENNGESVPDGLKSIILEWRNARNALKIAHASYEERGNIEPYSNDLLVFHSSSSGRAFIDTIEKLGPSKFNGAFKQEFGIAIDWNDSEESISAIYYMLTKSSFEHSETTEIADASDGIINLESNLDTIVSSFETHQLNFRNTMEEFRKQLDDISRHRDSFVKEFGDTVRTIEYQTNALAEEFNKKHGAAVNAISNNIDQVDQKLNDWTESKKAEYELSHPTVLWNERAEKQRKSSIIAAAFAVTTGIIGLPLGFCLSMSLFNQAHELFAKHVIPAKGASPVAAIVDPVFHYALFAAGAGTLAYLTLFLWLMRLVIRSYVTAQHLAIDAQARSAMTQTFIGLVREGTVKRAERAIVLEALFRPVTSGMVQEEGPPPISPAAIMAAAAGNKSTPV